MYNTNKYGAYLYIPACCVSEERCDKRNCVCVLPLGRQHLLEG